MRLILSLLLCFNVPSYAQGSSEPEFYPLKSIVTKLPGTALDSLETGFSKKSIPAWALILSTTAATLHYDEDIFLEGQKIGRKWGLSNDDHTKTMVALGDIDILRLPTDTASALYFLGDGWFDFMVAGSFMATGYFGEHSRPWNTSIQMIHGMTLSAFVVQGAKRAFGHETPVKRTEPRGKWRPFPASQDYARNTSMYDAMPSGHVMTTTLLFTVIRENYPEHDYWLWPFELGFLTVLGFAMVNNGVHWASDYPLGAGMGYVMGKAATRMYKRDKPEEEKSGLDRWQLFPGWDQEGTMTMNAMLEF